MARRRALDANEDGTLEACRQLLELNGAHVSRIVERVPKCYRCGAHFQSSERGIPDLMGWFPAGKVGRTKAGFAGQYVSLDAVAFFIEMKRLKGGKKRESQVVWIEKARAAGLVAFFANSVESMVMGFAEFGIVIRGV